MFSLFVLYRYIALRIKIKLLRKASNNIESNNPLVNNVKEKGLRKLLIKLKKFKIYFLISIAADLAVVFLVVMMLSYYMGGLSAITTMSNMWDDVAVDNSDSVEMGWQWGTNQNGNGIHSSGGIYPKDPVLKQLAMFIEAAEISAAEVNSQFGGNQVNPALILSINFRETGGAIINKLVEDTSLNIYSELIYENPACGKGSRCQYIKKGYSHFENGTVSGGVDSIDPVNNPANRDLTQYQNSAPPGGKPDHAIGYFQFENNSIDGLLVDVFPIGDYADKEYTADDRYKMDNTLGFIRPNIVYVPDGIMNVAQHNGDLNRYGDGLKQAWSTIQAKSWYKNLSLKDQQFCWAALKDLSYQGGSYISYNGAKAMIAALELVATMVYDEYLQSMYDIVPFLEEYHSDASGSVASLYNTNTHKISRPGDDRWTYSFNKLLTDQTLKQSTRTAAAKLKSTLSPGKFRTYAEAGNVSYYADIPPKSIAWISMGQQVYDIMKAEIDAAEKEEGSFIISRPEGVSKDNFKLTPGVGQGIWNGKTTEEVVGPNAEHMSTKGMWGTSYTLSNGNCPFNSLESKFHVPYFSQSSSRVEAWKGYNTGKFDLQNAGCGIYMWAHIASALQQRLINPPEMLVIGTHFGAFESGTGYFTWANGGEGHKKLFRSFGYELRLYTYNEVKQDAPWNDLNQALRKNIPSGFRCRTKWTSGGSHFLNIDAITDDGRYILAQTNNSVDEAKTWSRSDLFNVMHFKNYCLYVVDNM